MENYLELDSQERSNIAKIRMGAHKLRIETERYKTGSDRLDPKDRICIHCNLNSCEDETHFITECPKYENHRQVFFRNIYEENPKFTSYNNTQKMAWLMIVEEKKTLN